MGTRPRVAVELRPEGLVAARAEGALGVLGSVVRGNLREGALRPGLRAGNVADRGALLSALRSALDGISGKGTERSRYVTLVVPDAAVRVLLLDFDALPGKAAEALAVVRFRLKKLLPFDAEHAVVSYQIMSSGRDGVQVLAVAIPSDVLAEYEGLVVDAGYLPGAVLPSTLAAVAGVGEAEDDTVPALIVNAGPGAVTTAIVRGGLLLLHRTVDLALQAGSVAGAESALPAGDTQGASASRIEGLAMRGMEPGDRLPLANLESASEERSRQDLANFRRSELERFDLERAGYNAADYERADYERADYDRTDYERADYDRIDAETEMQTRALHRETSGQLPSEPDETVQVLNETDAVSAGREITQAVSVAAAYFEDTLGAAPPLVLAAGTMGAERLAAVLHMYGMDGLRVREMVDTAAIGVGASTSTVPRGWLAGVRGALRS